MICAPPLQRGALICASEKIRAGLWPGMRNAVQFFSFPIYIYFVGNDVSNDFGRFI